MRPSFLICFIAFIVVAIPGCVFVPAGCSAPTVSKIETGSPPVRPAVYKSISPAEAKRRLAAEPGIVLLDVRTPEEHEAERIPGSMLLPVEPVDMVTPGIRDLVPDRNTPVFIYCRSGRRSANTVRMLLKAGYADVYDLGGINSWPYETRGSAQ